MEIAINTLVVMVLGIVIIGGGIVLVGRLTSDGISIADELTREQEKQIAILLDEGQLVAVYPSTQKVSADKEGVYAIGVFSTLRDTQTLTLEITSPDTAPAQWKVNYFTELEARPDERATALVSVKPAKSVPKGEYTFIIRVNYTEEGESQIYDSPRFFTVQVQ